jgi:hypothetical protein
MNAPEVSDSVHTRLHLVLFEIDVHSQGLQPAHMSCLLASILRAPVIRSADMCFSESPIMGVRMVLCPLLWLL